MHCSASFGPSRRKPDRQNPPALHGSVGKTPARTHARPGVLRISVVGRTPIGTFQMLWDCSCGTGPLLGVDHRHCPTCGRPQDPLRRYFPDQRDAVPAPEWVAGSGADRHCPYCSTANAAATTFCASCGGPMDGSKEVERRETDIGTTAETVQDALSEARQEAQERREAQKVDHAPKTQEARERARGASPRRTPMWDSREEREPGLERDDPLKDLSQQWRLLGIVGGVIALLGLIWAIFFWEKIITAEVESRSWSRTQDIERYQALHDSSWCDEKPGDAYSVVESRRQRGTRTVVDCRKCDCHTERVKVGQTCHETNCRTERIDNGNGSYSADRVCDERCEPVYENREVCKDKTHKEPVYDDWCSYTVNRWRTVRTLSEEGDHNKSPVWPAVKFRACRGLGCERSGRRTETYIVYFRDVADGEEYECVFPQRTWETYEEGSSWRGVVKRLGSRFQCHTLTAVTVETG